MPIFAAIAAVGAIAGVASTISGLSAQAANKKDIKRKNEAASLANDEVEVINEKIRDRTKEQNVILREDIQAKNTIINQSNAELTESNQNLISLNRQTNEAVVGSNAERSEQVSLVNDLSRVRSDRTKRQAAREAILLRGRTLNLAANSGASLDSSGVEGGLGSLQSQLADTLGFASQDSAVNEKIFESSQREQDLVNVAQQLGFDTSVENLKALETQRKAANDLALQQNRTNLQISKSNNKINLLENKAARTKESAQLDPKEFISGRKNTVKNLTKKINTANNEGDSFALADDGAVLTKLAGGGIKKSYASGLVVKLRDNGGKIVITPDGVKTVTSPSGEETVSKVDESRVQKTVATIKALVPPISDGQPGGGGDD